MNLEWISEKGVGLVALIVGLGLIAIALIDAQYRYFYICVAILALAYGYKQFKKRNTPFEKREREIRRRIM